MIRFLLSILVVFVFVSGLAVGQDETTDPAYSTEMWLIAVVSGDGFELGYYTCRADAEVISNQAMTVDILGRMALQAFVPNFDLTVQVDTRDVDFVVLQQSESQALVEVTGEMRINLGSAFETLEVDTIITVIWENDRWRVCELSGFIPQTATVPLLAYMNEDSGNWDIYVVDARGQNRRQITTNRFNDMRPSWSPDGQSLVYMSGSENGWEISKFDLDGDTPQQITSNESADWRPVWSPDESKIAFLSDRTGVTQLYTMSTDGSNQVSLAEAPASAYGFEWSPDGSRIMTWLDDEVQGPGTYVLDTQSLARNRGVYVDPVTNTTYSGVIKWSPDGNRLAFSAHDSNCSSNCDEIVFIANGDGSDIRPLQSIAFRAGNARYLSWAPDSTRLVYTFRPTDDEDPQLVLHNVDTDTRAFVGENTGIYGGGVWAHGSDRIAVRRFDSATEQSAVTVLDVETGERFNIPFGDLCGLNCEVIGWSPDDRFILFYHIPEESLELDYTEQYIDYYVVNINTFDVIKINTQSIDTQGIAHPEWQPIPNG